MRNFAILAIVVGIKHFSCVYSDIVGPIWLNAGTEFITVFVVERKSSDGWNFIVYHIYFS